MIARTQERAATQETDPPPVVLHHKHPTVQRAGIVERLSRRFPLFARDTIARCVDRQFEVYAEAKVQTFVPILVERQLRAQLADLSGPGD